MARSATLERILRDFDTAVPQLPEGVVPREDRLRAAQELSRLGWPSARDEQWRYANLRAFDHVREFRPRAATAPTGLQLPDPLPGFERRLFVDGGRAHAAAGDTSPAAYQIWPADQRLGLLCDMFASDLC